MVQFELFLYRTNRPSLWICWSTSNKKTCMKMRSVYYSERCIADSFLVGTCNKYVCICPLDWQLHLQICKLLHPSFYSRGTKSTLKFLKGIEIYTVTKKWQINSYEARMRFHIPIVGKCIHWWSNVIGPSTNLAKRKQPMFYTTKYDRSVLFITPIVSGTYHPVIPAF